MCIDYKNDYGDDGFILACLYNENKSVIEYLVNNQSIVCLIYWTLIIKMIKWKIN